MPKATGQINRQQGGKVLPALCNVLGVLLLLAVVGLCAPLTLPQLAGGHVYDVVSGSMEPEIPVGSAVLVMPGDVGSFVEGDVVAYHDADSLITHRIVANRTATRELITKGDANDVEDLSPIPYDAVEGKVEAVMPGAGSFMAIYASTVGKVYLLLTAACGLMLVVLGNRMRASRREREALLEQRLADMGYADAADAGRTAPRELRTVNSGQASGAPMVRTSRGALRHDAASEDASPGDEARCMAPGELRTMGASQVQDVATVRNSPGAMHPQPLRRRTPLWRKVAIVVLLAVFVGSGAGIGYAYYQYYVSDILYHDASDQFTKTGSTASITVDFAALQAENPDVVGWIYCGGTPINYPVLQGSSNDEYLHTDYTGAYNLDGSIFVDADNTPGFVDSNTIIYGHHMNSGAMFACLEKWADQSFFEQHPIMWLLTPDHVYKVVLFSGHHVSAHSTWYDIYKTPGAEMDEFLAQAVAESDFTADVQQNLNPKARYIMLSTCAYIFDDARYALHGYLVTVD